MVALLACLNDCTQKKDSIDPHKINELYVDFDACAIPHSSFCTIPPVPRCLPVESLLAPTLRFCIDPLGESESAIK